MDLNCCENADPGCPLTQDNWEAWGNSLVKAAKENDIQFTQSHNPIYNVAAPDLVKDFAWQEELTRRSMIVSAMLGVKWVVAHAGTALPGGIYNRRETIERNCEYYCRLADQARTLGMEGVALENMAYFGPWSTTLPPQLCATTDGLITLVDACSHSGIGICWDFGHANLGHESQVESLRQIGSRLKATHVNDNMGCTDDHTLPFLGNISWESILPILHQVGYQGDLTYEIHKYMRRIPQPLWAESLETTFKTGQYLLKITYGEDEEG